MTVQPNPAAVSDFSNLPPFYGSSPFGSPYVLAGNRYEQTPGFSPIYWVDPKDVPDTFPMQAWIDQSGRYVAYWAWFNGDFINQSRQNDIGELEFRFPLRINTIQDVTRKHASLLFGEVIDGPDPLVKTSIQARKSLSGKEPSDNVKEFATVCENVVNEVWSQSNGRSLQQEAGELEQFLGGHAFQVVYQSWNNDVDVPIFIRSWKADLFLPIWENGNYWDLSEAYIVCRMESAVAKASYGIDTNGAFVFYVEHWTKDKYSIYVDGKPITMEVNGILTEFSGLKNPFGFVPFVYIPHLREGSFYGSSHVPSLVGLVEEYNSAMANLGDAIQDSVHRERFIRNSPKRTPVVLPSGKKATDLGLENPSAHNPPDAFTEDPPQLSQGLVTYAEKVYEQIRRTGFLPAVAEGEDEGSQRSGATLDIRFWAATAHAKVERGYWETGLNQLALMILKICDKKDLWERVDDGINVPPGFIRQLTVSQQWASHLPRDRQAEVNEFLSRLQAGGMSLEKFVDAIGDVENKTEEIKQIKDWLTFQASLQMKAKPTDQSPLQSNAYAKQDKSIDKN